MIGRIIGGIIGGAMTRQTRSNPVAGAVIGAGAMFVARRLLPARYAALGATAAAAYATKKWVERSERKTLYPNTPIAPSVEEPTGVNTAPTAPPISKDAVPKDAGPKDTVAQDADQKDAVPTD